VILAAVALVVCVLLFLLAFMTRRRFGVLGLGLGCGLVMNQLWNVPVTDILQRYVHAPLYGVSYGTLATVVLALLPSILLLISGPTYGKKLHRLAGSLLYALFAGVVCIEALQQSLVMTGVDQRVFEQIIAVRPVVVTVGIMLAIADMLHTHIRGGHAKEKSKSTKH
jgi:hypothetical protein